MIKRLTVEGFELTSPSPSAPIPQHLVSTWEGLPTPIVAEEVEAVVVDTVAAVVTAAMEEATVTAVDMVEEPADTVVEVDTVAGLLHVVHLLLTTAVAAVEDGPEGTIVRVQDPTRLLVDIKSVSVGEGELIRK